MVRGAADPEYPAFSPNVVAVGGTSLALNNDGSYNSETGWGYYSDAAGALIGSGGGISRYEPEPAYQQSVQDTGYRTTPDVALDADPATGAWIADPYNLDPSNPFEVVGGTSLSAPAWAGLVALVNQGRAAAGESALNSTSPTDTQQALYMLPQSDYNMITSGNNGYSAGAGYNLVTGLGTPVASSLVPDLVAYQGPGTTYNGPTVAPLQDANLVNTGTSPGSPIDVFSVFDSLTVPDSGIGLVPHAGPGSDVSVRFASPVGPGQSTGSEAQGGNGFGPNLATSPGPGRVATHPLGGTAGTQVSVLLSSRQPVWSTGRPMLGLSFRGLTQPTIVSHGLSAEQEATRSPAPPHSGLLLDRVLEDLAAESVLVRGWRATQTPETDSQPAPEIAATITPASMPETHAQADESTAKVAAALVVAGSYGYGTVISAARKRQSKSLWNRRGLFRRTS